MPRQLTEYPDLMTVDEVAEYLRCCSKTVYEMVRAQMLETYRIGRKIRIVRRSLEHLN